jgi:hypothetical protein
MPAAIGLSAPPWRRRVPFGSNARNRQKPGQDIEQQKKQRNLQRHPEPLDNSPVAGHVRLMRRASARRMADIVVGLSPSTY